MFEADRCALHAKREPCATTRTASTFPTSSIINMFPLRRLVRTHVHARCGRVTHVVHCRQAVLELIRVGQMRAFRVYRYSISRRLPTFNASALGKRSHSALHLPHKATYPYEAFSQQEQIRLLTTCAGTISWKHRRRIRFLFVEASRVCVSNCNTKNRIRPEEKNKKISTTTSTLFLDQQLHLLESGQIRHPLTCCTHYFPPSDISLSHCP